MCVYMYMYIYIYIYVYVGSRGIQDVSHFLDRASITTMGY